MCPPVLAAVAIGAVVAGGAAKSYAANQKSQADEKAYLQQGENLDKQAAIVQQQADWDVSRTEDKQKRVAGAQRAGYAAAGVDSSQGTPVNIQFDSMNESQKDIYAIRFGAKVKSDNLQTEANTMRTNATNTRNARGLVTIAPVIDSVATIATIGAGGGSGIGGNITKFGRSIFSSAEA